MPKFKSLVNSFAFGELGAELSGRSDIKEYSQGAKSIINFLPRQQGGVQKRPGLHLDKVVPAFNSEIFNTTSEPVYTPFVEGDVIAFKILEVGSQRLHIIGKRVVVSGTERTVLAFYDYDNEVSGSNLAPLTMRLITTLHLPELVPGEIVQVKAIGDGGVITSTEGTIAPHHIRAAANELGVVSVNTIENIFFGKGNIGTPNPFSGGSIRTGYIAPLGMPFTSFSITGETVEVISNYTENIYLLEFVLQGSAKVSDIEGRYIRVKASGIERLFYVTDIVGPPAPGANQIYAYVINPKTAAGAIEVDFETPTDNWSVSQWGGVKGFPSVCDYHQNRLILAGTTQDSQSDIIWFGQTDDLYQFTEQRYEDAVAGDAITMAYYGAAQPSDSFQKVLGASDIDRVVWTSSGDNLIAGTTAGEYAVFTVDGTFTNATVGTRKQTGHGGVNISPVVIDGSSLFVTRDAKTLREIIYNDTQKSYITKNLNKLNPNIIHRVPYASPISDVKLRKMIYQSERNILWFITDDDRLIGATIDLFTGTIGWHRHFTAGKVIDADLVRNGRNTFDLQVVLERDGILSLNSIGPEFLQETLNVTSSYDYDLPIFADSAMVLRASVAQTEWFYPLAATGDSISYLIEGGVTKLANVTPVLALADPLNAAPAANFVITEYSDFAAVAKDTWVVPYEENDIINVNSFFGTEELTVNAAHEITTGAVTEFINVITIVPTNGKTNIDLTGLGFTHGQKVSVSGSPADAIITTIVNSLELTTVETTQIVIGRTYPVEIETMPVNIQMQSGETLGDRIRNVDINALVYNSGQFEAGDRYKVYDVSMAPDLFTGVVEVDLPNGINRDSTVLIQSDSMLPLSINALNIGGVTY